MVMAARLYVLCACLAAHEAYATPLGVLHALWVKLPRDMIGHRYQVVDLAVSGVSKIVQVVSRPREWCYDVYASWDAAPDESACTYTAMDPSARVIVYVGTFTMLQILLELWLQVTPYTTFWQEGYILPNDVPGDSGVTVYMRYSMFPTRWFWCLTESVSNGRRFYATFIHIWIPALWTVEDGTRTMEWFMLRGSRPARPLYPTIPAVPGGTVQDAIMQQQRESMNTIHPVPMAFVDHMMPLYAVITEQELL